MPVEFQCRECRRLLRVSDENVGKKARCPECGTIQEVVSGSSPFADTAPEFPPIADEFSAFRPSIAPASDGGNPYQSPQMTGGASAISVFLPREAILARVQGPAIAMMTLAIIAMLFSGLGFVGQLVVAFSEQEAPGEIITNAGVLMVFAFMYGLVLLGAIRMRKLKSYGLSVTAAALSMVPCSVCCLISFPVGIWALVVLLDQRVRAAFE